MSVIIKTETQKYHRSLLSVGELSDLEALARLCGEQQRWTFSVSSLPLNMPGAVLLPPNVMAFFRPTDRGSIAVVAVPRKLTLLLIICNRVRRTLLDGVVCIASLSSATLGPVPSSRRRSWSLTVVRKMMCARPFGIHWGGLSCGHRFGLALALSVQQWSAKQDLYKYCKLQCTI